MSVGAEVYYFNGISHSDAMKELTIDQTSCILVEMPLANWTDGMYRELEELHDKQNLLPVVAHVERYFGRFRTYGIPERLEQLPVLVQANAEFFLNKASSARALRMLKKGQIHLLGSDCHDLSHRAPNLQEAVALIERRLGKGAIDAICRWQQQALQEEM